VEHLADSPLAPLGENKEFEPMALRATAQLRIILVLLDQGLLTEIATASV
jgi:hypothetical protein